MDIIDKIDEATKKPTLEEFLSNKRNKNKLIRFFEDQYDEWHDELAMEIIQDDRYDTDEDADFADAYASYGYSLEEKAEDLAAQDTILKFKRGFDYKRRDEQNWEKRKLVTDLMEKYGVSF
jgi:hypothetical protein